jgi:hypothetical protein
MGAHWKTAMREHDFDPKIVVNAPARLGTIEATIALRDMKGAVIGDAENCSGARCLRRVLTASLAEKDIKGDLFLFLGASRAIVAWRNQRGRQYGYRFIVNGLPKTQDRTMNVVGELVALRPPQPSKRTGRRQGSKKNQTGSEPNGRNSTVTATRSLAAQLRSVA